MQIIEKTGTDAETPPVTQGNMSDAIWAAVQEFRNRTPEEREARRARARELYKPKRDPPPGKTVWDMIAGQWPGDETDEEVEAALEELS